MQISTSSPMDHLRALGIAFLAGVVTTATTGLAAYLAARRERGY